MYNLTKWLDHVVDPDTQQVIQQGTPMSADNFNNMEKGILDDYVTGELLAIAAKQLQVLTNVESQDVTLTNTLAYPFNNSKTTVSLATARITADYTIDVELLSHTGEVGDIEISDKLLNGFKIAFTGSATSVKVRLRVKGGL